MAITADDVRHLCKLSSLALGEAELLRMAQELEAIVGYVQQLQEVDTTGVEPIANVAGLTNVTRAGRAGGDARQPGRARQRAAAQRGRLPGAQGRRALNAGPAAAGPSTPDPAPARAAPLPERLP